MAKADELRAELEVAELEEELIKAKGTKAGPSRELKDRLRAARQQQRIARAPYQGEQIAALEELREIRQRARENG